MARRLTPPGITEGTFETALALHQQGRLREAERAYRAVLKVEPEHSGALHHLGVVQAQRGRLDDAIRLMRQALARNAQSAEANNDLGVALATAKRLDEAIKFYERALELKPDYAEAHFNLGNALQALGRHQDAALQFERAIELRPTNAEAQNNLGVSLQVLGGHQDAIIHFERALALRPAYAEAHSNLGVGLQALDRHADAIVEFERALVFKPSYVDAQYNLGNSLYHLDRFAEAAKCCEGVISMQPNHARARNNLGNCLSALGRHEDAIPHFRRALAGDPSYAEAHYNLGRCLQMLNRHAESLDAYARAIALKPEFPEAHRNESQARLVLGDFDLGWKKFEWRWFSLPRRDFKEPLWLGEMDIAGKTILIHAERGLGDTVQFCRYVPLIRDRGANVVFEVQPELVELMRDSFGNQNITVLARGDELLRFDFQCPLMSLPLACGTALETIPCLIPYLKADPERRDPWATWLDDVAPAECRIGLVWAGNPRKGLHKEFQRIDARRSVSLSAYRDLLHIEGLTFVSLQKGEAAAQAVHAEFTLLDRTNELRSFADTAALVTNLDLVITVDTAVAHVAGGLGKPVWMLSRFDGCWRWLLDREDSPWYPTMRIFRQPAPSDWESVIERIAGDLRRLAAGDEAVLRPQSSQE